MYMKQAEQGKMTALYCRLSKEDFDTLREKAPAIVEELGEAVVEAAAVGLSVREGKR